MKIVHIESGLGNQMLSYCEYLALKFVNPKDDYYLETIIYEIPECNDVICQWNGYELERIFGIDTPPNIKTLFTESQWSKIIDEVRASRFWEKRWNYPVYITQALKNAGLEIENIRGNFELNPIVNKNTVIYKVKQRIKDTWLYVKYKNTCSRLFPQKEILTYENKDKLFIKTEKNLFTGQWLSFYRVGNDRGKIDHLIRNTFLFPQFDSLKDIETEKLIRKRNSVAIHVRRGDALYSNSWCYKYGYFKHAVKVIKSKVDKPLFVFFTDPDSVDWCKHNSKVFNINFDREDVLFVDWHEGKNSYKDMQMMSCCKHAIITTSSFGWWGAYFISNPDKITISPYVSLDTTCHCW